MDTFNKLLISFAVGSLIGDAFVHLIPMAFGRHDHDHGDEDHRTLNEGHDHHDDDHEHNKKELADSKLLSLVLCLGFFFFYSTEKVLHKFGSNHHVDVG